MRHRLGILLAVFVGAYVLFGTMDVDQTGAATNAAPLASGGGRGDDGPIDAVP